jgi:TetR/AcrR family tetracycline transcriptional repressor
MLTREKIVEAGLAIVDEQGQERLTMRGLAQRLGVTATAIYHYVEGRDELLEAILDHVCAAIVADADDSGDWRHRLSSLLESLIEHSMTHPAASVWAITSYARQEPMLRLHEAILATLDDAGFPPREAVRIKGILLRFCVGHLVLHESAPGHEWRTLPKDRFPHYRAAGPALDVSRPAEVFTSGLTLLITGLAEPTRGNPSTPQAPELESGERVGGS